VRKKKAFVMGRKDLYDVEITKSGDYIACYEVKTTYPVPQYVQIAKFDQVDGSTRVVCNVTNLKRGGLSSPGAFDFERGAYVYVSWWWDDVDNHFVGSVNLNGGCQEQKIMLDPLFSDAKRNCEEFGIKGITV